MKKKSLRGRADIDVRTVKAQRFFCPTCSAGPRPRGEPPLDARRGARDYVGLLSIAREFLSGNGVAARRLAASNERRLVDFMLAMDDLLEDFLAASLPPRAS